MRGVVPGVVDVVVVRGDIEAPRCDGASKGLHVRWWCQQLSCDTPSCEWGAAQNDKDAPRRGGRHPRWLDSCGASAALAYLTWQEDRSRFGFGRAWRAARPFATDAAFSG